MNYRIIKENFDRALLLMEGDLERPPQHDPSTGLTHSRSRPDIDVPKDIKAAGLERKLAYYELPPEYPKPGLIMYRPAGAHQGAMGSFPSLNFAQGAASQLNQAEGLKYTYIAQSFERDYFQGDLTLRAIDDLKGSEDQGTAFYITPYQLRYETQPDDVEGLARMQGTGRSTPGGYDAPGWSKKNQ